MVERFVHVVDFVGRADDHEIGDRPWGGRLLRGDRLTERLPRNQVAVRVIDSDSIRSPAPRPKNLWGACPDSAAIDPESLELSPRRASATVNDGTDRSVRLAGLHELL